MPQAVYVRSEPVTNPQKLAKRAEHKHSVLCASGNAAWLDTSGKFLWNADCIDKIRHQLSSVLAVVSLCTTGASTTASPRASAQSLLLDVLLNRLFVPASA